MTDEQLVALLKAESEHATRVARAQWRMRVMVSIVVSVVLFAIYAVIIANVTADHTTSASVNPTPIVDPAVAVSNGEFQWEEVNPNATYRVAIYRRGKGREGLVDMLDTEENFATIALPPGRYKWIVWPVYDGTRSPESIVNSSIVVE